MITLPHLSVYLPFVYIQQVLFFQTAKSIPFELELPLTHSQLVCIDYPYTTPWTISDKVESVQLGMDLDSNKSLTKSPNLHKEAVKKIRMGGGWCLQ